MQHFKMVFQCSRYVSSEAKCYKLKFYYIKPTLDEFG